MCTLACVPCQHITILLSELGRHSVWVPIWVAYLFHLILCYSTIDLESCSLVIYTIN